MATVRERNGKWQAQVRLTGFGPRTATFATASKAWAWASQTEKSLLEGGGDKIKDVRQLRGMTLADLAKAWSDSGAITRANTTGYNSLLSDAIAQLPLTQITKKITREWRNRQLSHLKPDSIRRYARVPRGAWEYGLEILELPIGPNPFTKLDIKASGGKRDRRLVTGELELLLSSCVDACAGIDQESISDLIIWAIETAMRRGEIAKIRSTHVSEDQRFLLIPETKTDTPRRIPLTKKAQEILRKWISLGLGERHNVLNSIRIFPYTPQSITRAFRKVTSLAGVSNLRFHDLRHEALSRLNARGLTVFDIKLVSGHTRTETLSVYIQPELERVAELMEC